MDVPVRQRRMDRMVRGTELRAARAYARAAEIIELCKGARLPGFVIIGAIGEWVNE